MKENYKKYLEILDLQNNENTLKDYLDSICIYKIATDQSNKLYGDTLYKVHYDQESNLDSQAIVYYNGRYKEIYKIVLRNIHSQIDYNKLCITTIEQLNTALEILKI